MVSIRVLTPLVLATSLWAFAVNGTESAPSRGSAIVEMKGGGSGPLEAANSQTGDADQPVDIVEGAVIQARFPDRMVSRQGSNRADPEALGADIRSYLAKHGVDLNGASGLTALEKVAEKISSASTSDDDAVHLVADTVLWRPVLTMEKAWIHENAGRFAAGKELTTEEAETLLIAQATRQVQKVTDGEWDRSASRFLAASSGAPFRDGSFPGENLRMFRTTFIKSAPEYLGNGRMTAGDRALLESFDLLSAPSSQDLASAEYLRVSSRRRNVIKHGIVDAAMSTVPAATRVISFLTIECASGGLTACQKLGVLEWAFEAEKDIGGPTFGAVDRNSRYFEDLSSCILYRTAVADLRAGTITKAEFQVRMASRGTEPRGKLAKTRASVSPYASDALFAEFSEYQAKSSLLGKTLPWASRPVRVTAEIEVGDNRLLDLNQASRPISMGDGGRKTLIAGQVDATDPDANMETAYPQIAVLQRAFDAGYTKSGSATLTVIGDTMAPDSDVARHLLAMAARSDLTQLTVHEADGRTLTWRDGADSWTVH